MRQCLDPTPLLFDTIVISTPLLFRGILKGAGVGDVPNPWGYQPGLNKPIPGVEK